MLNEMKFRILSGKITKILIIICLGVFVLQAQDITHKLGGITDAETFDVTDSNNNLLFRINGKGNVGIGITPSFYKLDINGTLKTKYFMMVTDADDGDVLKSNAIGQATWQPDIDIGTWFTSHLYVVTKTISVPGDNIKSETLSCNDVNDLAISGGWEFPTTNAHLSQMYPVGSNSFKFLIYNGQSTARDVPIYCKCLQID